jgi:hypothetical protein
MIIEFPQATRWRLGKRTLNEAEMRAIGIMFWQANVLARRTIAGWAVRGKKKPTQDEMLQLLSTLHGAEETAEQIATSPPGDGHLIEGVFRVICEEIELLDAERQDAP